MVITSLRHDRGSATVELVILVPAFLVLLALLIMGGRMALANQSVQSAASEAARAASQERGSDSQEKGLAAAQAFLAKEGFRCEEVEVTVDAAGKDSAPGTKGQFVNATVTCTVPLSDLALPGVGGSRTVSASSSSPIDVYRER